MEPRIESRFLESQVGFFIRRPCHIASLGHIPGLSSGLCVSVCYVSLCIRLILKKRGGGVGNPYP